MTVRQKKVLIVSPHFPPVNAADMHRVRMSLPFFREFGWEPVVLTVETDGIEGVKDPLLEHTVPDDVQRRTVRTLPLSLTRRIGIGSLALRTMPFFYAAGARLIRELGIDLVYFSTTQFLLMPLGRRWKRRLGVPFVLDFQDLWVSQADVSEAFSRRAPKHALMRRIHGLLEPWTLRDVDGLIAVSPAYVQTLRSRYPWLERCPAEVLPFGAAEDDFRVLRQHPRPNPFFRTGDGMIHGVYVGRGGSDMANALRVAFGALARGLRDRPDLFGRVRLHFIGTSYAPADRAEKSIESIAAEAGVSAQVDEHTGRVPYFDALQLLVDGDFLFVPGSDDPMYSPSKLYPYMLAGRPLIAVFHGGSPATEILRSTRAGAVVEFDRNDLLSAIGRFQQEWTALLDRPRTDRPAVDWGAFTQYGAREVTRRQCALFDRVVETHAVRPSGAAHVAAVKRTGVTCP